MPAKVNRIYVKEFDKWITSEDSFFPFLPKQKGHG